MARTQGHTLTDQAVHAGDDYSAWQAYGDSKLANYQFGIELARRLDAAGSPVSSLVAHPGLSNTNLQAASVENDGAGIQGPLWHFVARFVGMKQGQGALPELRAATDPDARNGEFYGPRWNLRGAPVKIGVSEKSAPPSATARMWQTSEARTDTMFNLDSTT